MLIELQNEEGQFLDSFEMEDELFDFYVQEAESMGISVEELIRRAIIFASKLDDESNEA